MRTFVNMERIWIYQADRPLSDAERTAIMNRLENFTSQWKTHGTALAAKAEIRHDRFIILMVNDAVVPPSGCSIDTSVRLLKKIEAELGVSLFDRLQIAYRDDDGSVRAVPREAFERLLETGEVTDSTIVFNNLITSYPELDTHWEVPLRESWHAKVFLIDS